MSTSKAREPIGLRVDQEMFDEIDAVAEDICLLGGVPKRSYAIRALIGLGLREVDSVGLDAFLARFEAKPSRGRGRGAMAFDEKRRPQTKGQRGR